MSSMTDIRINLALLMVAVVWPLAGCQSLSGELTEGKYRSPDGRVHIALPDIPEHMIKVTDDQYGENDASLVVRISSPAGSFYRVETSPLAFEERGTLDQAVPAERARLCQDFIQSRLIPIAYDSSDDVLFGESRRIPSLLGGSAYIESRLPNGGFWEWSHDIDGDGKRERWRSDELRGYLVFFETGHIVVAQATSEAHRQHQDIPGEDPELYERVVNFAKGIQINGDPEQGPVD